MGCWFPHQYVEDTSYHSYTGKNWPLPCNAFVYSIGTSNGVQYSCYLKKKPLHCIQSDVLDIKKM